MKDDKPYEFEIKAPGGLAGLEPILPKPGWRTTEWIAFIIVTVLTALILAEVIPSEGPWLKVASMVVEGIAAGLYAQSRGKAKAGK